MFAFSWFCQIWQQSGQGLHGICFLFFESECSFDKAELWSRAHRLMLLRYAVQMQQQAANRAVHWLCSLFAGVLSQDFCYKSKLTKHVVGFFEEKCVFKNILSPCLR